MPPTRWAPPRGPKTVAGHERTGSLQSDDLEVKVEAMSRNTNYRLVDLLTGLAERIVKQEASQEAKDQLLERESSVIGSVIGQGQPVNRGCSRCDTAEGSVAKPASKNILRGESTWVCKGG